MKNDHFVPFSQWFKLTREVDVKYLNQAGIFHMKILLNFPMMTIWYLWIWLLFVVIGYGVHGISILLNPFSINVPLMDKPGSWFLQAKCLKNTCRRRHFVSKNQLPGFYISGILVENGLNIGLSQIYYTLVVIKILSIHKMNYG